MNLKLRVPCVVPAVIAILMAASAGPANAQLSIDTSQTADWKISNGALSLDWSSTGGNVWALSLSGHTDNLVDTTNLNGSNLPKGFYMDNSGVGTGATTAGYDLQPGNYLDWWITTASNAANAFTYTQHFVLFPNDPGIHTYILFNHSATDIAGSLGQVQFVFRVNLSLFTSTYSYNSGLNNLGATIVPQPDPTVTGTTDPGRQVQDATVDLHGLNVPAGFTRNFYTKYDYSSYEYLHQLHGVVGSTYGGWVEFPSQESMVGGPVKQNLIFTNTILIGEMLSDHLCYNLGYTPPQGQNSQRLFGPVYYRFNTGSPASMFQDALGSLSGLRALYDKDSDLIASGYVPSTARGSVAATVTGGGSSTSNAAWTVLADAGSDFQFTNRGAQYWANNLFGNVSLNSVIPGNYRLSSYVLGQWGETRVDNVAVTAGKTTNVSASFTPENFGTAPPVWTIGTPTRSADKFRHGVGTNGQDDREFWGAWNYWSDFQANAGAAVYYATAVGATPATNDLTQWNYIQWHSFDPGLYAGIYNSTDDTTDGYKYIIPGYAHTSSTVPPWQVNFTTTSAQQAQGPYVVLSVSLASTNSDLTASLNGHSLTWGGYSTLKTSDAQVRSGLAGTHQWVVFQWPTGDLSAPGQANQISFSVDQSQGVMYDALRLEIVSASAIPGVRGWNDYEFVTSNVYVPADDTRPNPTAPRTDRLINLSARANVTISNPLAAGFIISGPNPKTVVVRGVGPGLAPYGLANFLAHPQLSVFDAGGNVLATNAGWGGGNSLAAAFAQVGAFSLPPASADAALILTLQPGSYTLRLSDGASDNGGLALAEVYDASPDPTGASQKLVNLSSTALTAGGASALISGFTVNGNASKKLLIRGVGPALTKFGVSGALAAPLLSLYDGTGALLAQNAGWGTPLSTASGLAPATSAQISAATTSAGAFPLSSGSKDSAVIVTLAPGSYSAQVSAGSGSGAAMVEVYELPE